MGSTNTPSYKHAQHDGTVLYQSHFVGIWGRTQPILLKLFPIGPPRCKVVIYKSPDTCGLWSGRETDTWCISLSLDDYQCNIFIFGYTRLPSFRFSQTISPTLPSSVPHVEQTLTRGSQQTCYNIMGDAIRRPIRCPQRHHKQSGNKHQPRQHKDTHEPTTWLALTSRQPTKVACYPSTLKRYKGWTHLSPQCQMHYLVSPMHPPSWLHLNQLQNVSSN